MLLLLIHLSRCPLDRYTLAYDIQHELECMNVYQKPGGNEFFVNHPRPIY